MFEAGLFGGVLGMRRTFILHARESKLPTDLLGLICIRYGDAATPAEIKALNQKLRQAIESEGRVARIEGLWWQFSLTARGPARAFRHQPAANLARPRRGAGGERPVLAGGRQPLGEVLE